MWYAKMYFSGEREFFENDAFGMQGLTSKQLELLLQLQLPKGLGKSTASGNYFGSKGVCNTVFRDKEAGREVFGMCAGRGFRRA